MDRLDPGLRTGSCGQLQEWKADRDDPADPQWAGGAARRVVLTAGRTRTATVRATLFTGGTKTFRARAGGRYTFTPDS
ncbi:hypothetical protein ABZ565_23545 [Streptomyces sp. NPDC016469]|uniref:hypothetical protein n=1 Tax=Streptomyces sp. NPDC016469 TaxID=3157191 RepID=UPI0033D1D2C2